MDGAQIAAIITGFGGLLAGIIGALSAYNTSKSSATKGEMESLRSTIEALSKENTRLCARVEALEVEGRAKDIRIDELESELADLKRYIRENGLELPKRQHGK